MNNARNQSLLKCLTGYVSEPMIIESSIVAPSPTLVLMPTTVPLILHLCLDKLENLIILHNYTFYVYMVTYLKVFILVLYLFVVLIATSLKFLHKEHNHLQSQNR